jgi:hypothetical protein
VTTKKNTARRGKVDTCGGLYDERGNDHNPLDRETSRTLLWRLHAELTNDGDMEPPADLLLLLYALAHEEDSRERWIIYNDAREMFAVQASAKVDAALDNALAEALARVKGGAR